MRCLETIHCAGCSAVEKGLVSIPFTLMVKSMMDLTLDTL